MEAVYPPNPPWLRHCSDAIILVAMGMYDSFTGLAYFICLNERPKKSKISVFAWFPIQVWTFACLCLHGADLDTTPCNLLFCPVAD
jgi:hypothetical protein